MRLSKLFFKTFKEAPAEADVPSHQLLERAGLIKRLSRGHFSYTPLMWRILTKLKAIVRQELEKRGAQELFMPQLQTEEVWQASGRWEAYKAEKLTFITQDREGHAYCLGPTHEEVITHLVKNWLTSYKQLPQNLYQITNKFRDEIRPRFGLMRCKEFLMKDAYTFCADEAQMKEQYQKMREAYSAILDRLELNYVIVQADSGKIGGAKSQSEEFQVLADIGEDAVLVCGEHAYNSEKAPTAFKPFDYPRDEKALEKQKTLGIQTLEALSEFTKLPAERLLKTVIYKLTFADQKQFVGVGIRGDLEVNPLKVLNHFGALEIDLAEEDELKEASLPKGYLGPVESTLPFVFDLSCKPMKQFVVGANEKDAHYFNVEWQRDIKEPLFKEFAQAKGGDLCPLCPGERYEERRGIEVGHIFNFGSKYSEALGAMFQDENGKTKPLLMGSFGIGIGRLAQAAIEQKYDEKGIVWPKEIAPFHLVITAVNAKDSAQKEAADTLYDELLGQGIEVLYDDRKERLGFKLKDSDLLGVPYKCIIGKNFLENQEIEIEPRAGEKMSFKREEFDSWIAQTFLSAHK